jgi:uncharacterized membrane protein YhaH (DUF805 family)
MDIKYLLTSFQGRIRRQHYWLASIGAGVVIGVVASIVLAVFHANPLGLLLIAVLYVAAIYVGIALGVKRCHDRDRTGWFLALGLIPLVNLWVLVEVGFLDGTQGPNKYGPSPKGIGGEAVPAV